MSTIDAWEYEHSRRYKKRKPYQARKKSHKREVQLSMKLYGGTSDKDRGEPFNDELPPL